MENSKRVYFCFFLGLFAMFAVLLFAAYKQDAYYPFSLYSAPQKAKGSPIHWITVQENWKWYRLVLFGDVSTSPTYRTLLNYCATNPKMRSEPTNNGTTLVIRSVAHSMGIVEYLYVAPTDGPKESMASIVWSVSSATHDIQQDGKLLHVLWIQLVLHYFGFPEIGLDKADLQEVIVENLKNPRTGKLEDAIVFKFKKK